MGDALIAIILDPLPAWIVGGVRIVGDELIVSIIDIPAAFVGGVRTVSNELAHRHHPRSSARLDCQRSSHREQ